jgi:hypothetical protein
MKVYHNVEQIINKFCVLFARALHDSLVFVPQLFFAEHSNSYARVSTPFLAASQLSSHALQRIPLCLYPSSSISGR